ncbi:hypothetical protein [Tuwongella immobilis]|uniref:Phage metallopeptidase domain-containing protein n=1 Tax=Tuwongella immobilis TaxID=692036 RepID=A0A6C2YI62_9BACT|nr:hypothetical protein [Tuwongella immobilis]VIP00755.1 Uncharacterized protein OS=Planctomyces maris DSM 8797 GN=PM8797T_12323 PE=4 SV=1 [Tuwongella immobilis]VTR96928.1 Uncharacterized protein OS=Planctomyces maris DSM 8797 GN=PM8797T_12323 PE=4 SV=1 [Tuwongella immobilis]
MARPASRSQLSRQSHPLVLSWNETSPLPQKLVQGDLPARGVNRGDSVPPWLETGRIDQPFDFCGHIRRLTADIAVRSPAFYHLDVSRLLFTFTQARNNRRHGLQARVTPMRFRDGQLVRVQRGVTYQVQRYFVDGREVLYVVSFCLPRFFTQGFDEKLVTLFHELYHISPSFDGDLRRHGGRYDVHTASQKEYDQHMAELAREYLQLRPEPRLYDFLRLNFVQLCQRHGAVMGTVVPRPKLVPVRILRSG